MRTRPWRVIERLASGRSRTCSARSASAGPTSEAGFVAAVSLRWRSTFVLRSSGSREWAGPSLSLESSVAPVPPGTTESSIGSEVASIDEGWAVASVANGSTTGPLARASAWVAALIASSLWLSAASKPAANAASEGSTPRPDLRIDSS